MKTIKAIVFTALFASIIPLYAQNVAVTDDSTYAADNSAILDVMSVSKGLLIPRLTEVEKSNISNPANGLLVYQTDGNSGFYYFHGTGQDTGWKKLAQMSDSYWTRDPMREHLFNSYLNDSVGIGITHPEEKLEVGGNIAIDTIDPYLLFIQDSLHAGRISYFMPPEVGYLHLQAWDLNNFEANGLVIRSPGQDVGIGTLNPSAKLDVAGKAKVAGFQMTSPSDDGYILTAKDIYGNAEWRTAPVKGTGNINYIPRFTGARTIANSPLRLVYIIEEIPEGVPDPGGPPQDSVFVCLNFYDSFYKGARMKFANKFTGDSLNAGFDIGMGTREDSLLAFLRSYGESGLSLGVDSIETMRLDTAGHVGIGIQKPEELLHLRGSMLIDSSNAFILFRDSGSYQYPFNNYAEIKHVRKVIHDFEYESFLHIHTWETEFNRSNDTGITIRPPFNYVGIGTSIPEENLEVEGNIMIDTANASLIFADRHHPHQQAAEEIARIRWEYLQNESDEKVLHLQAYHEYMNEPGLAISSYKQFVGIGLLEPSAKLHVLSDDYLGDLIRFDDEDDDDTPFVIDNDGNVGIGLESPQEKLDIEGSIKITGDIKSDNDLQIITLNSNRKIIIDNGYAKITLDADGDILIESSKDMNFSAPHNMSFSAGNTMSFSASGLISIQSQLQTNVVGGPSSLELYPGMARLDGSPLIYLNGGGTQLAGQGYAVACNPQSGTGNIVQGNPTVLMGMGSEKKTGKTENEKEE